MATKPKATEPERTPEQVGVILGRLFARYGIRSSDEGAYRWALIFAARDGLLQVPARRGAPAKWRGILGLELVTAVEALQAATNPKMTVEEACNILQAQNPKKWAAGDLEKRFYEARQIWGLGPEQFGRKLLPFFDIPENS